MRRLAAAIGIALFTQLACAQALTPWSGGATPPLELADLQGAAHKLADYRGSTVLAVNVGESGRAARGFAEKMPVQFTWLLDPEGRTAKTWRARVLPASYVVGPDGAIRYSALGALDWSSGEVRAAMLALTQ